MAIVGATFLLAVCRSTMILDGRRLRVDAEPGIDVVVDMPGVGMARKFSGPPRPRVAGLEVLDVALHQPFEFLGIARPCCGDLLCVTGNRRAQA
jgi:hypothetical protein